MQKQSLRFWRRIFPVLLLALCLLGSLTAVPVRAIQDTQPPEILSLSIDKHETGYPGQVTFTGRARDDISGVVRIDLAITRDEGGSYTSWLCLRKDGDAFTCVFDIPVNLAAGTWRVTDCTVEDFAGNTRTYSPAKSPGKELLADLYFTVNRAESSSDVTLCAASVSPPRVKYGEKATLRVQAESQLSVSCLEAVYDSSGETYTVRLDAQGGGVFAGEIDTAELSPYEGIYRPYLGAVIGGERQEVVYGGFEEALTLTLTEVRPDPGLPEVVSITVDKTEVKTPGVITYTVEFSPRKPDVARLQFDVNFIPQAEVERPFSGERSGISPELLYDEASGTYEGRVELDADAKPGCYRIDRAYITSRGGELGCYVSQAYLDWRRENGWNVEDVRMLPAVSPVTVVPGAQGDVNAGTLGDDYVEKIRGAADGATIAVDCSELRIIKKETFEAIRGTNKTLLLENGGFQWIFHGRDIVNPAIDLDANVFICRLDETENTDGAVLREMTDGAAALQVQFPPNGLLPGKALFKIKADYTFRSYLGVKDLYLYYYDPDACELDFLMKKLEVTDDGYYEFPITHNSTYMLSSRQAAPRFVSVKTGGGGDGSGKKVVEQVKAQEKETVGTAGNAVSSSAGSGASAPRTTFGVPAGNKGASSGATGGFPWGLAAAIAAVALLAAAGVLAFWKRETIRAWLLQRKNG